MAIHNTWKKLPERSKMGRNVKHPNYDFCGWATKYDVLCDDGVTIAKGAFNAQDGAKVPLCWMHGHGVKDVIGHAFLESSPEGMYAYGFVNDDSEEGKKAKSMLKHGDIDGMSIFANKLTKVGSRAVKGTIRELSLVISGANPTAVIEDVMVHSGMDDEEDEDAYIIHSALEEVYDYDTDEDDGEDDDEEFYDKSENEDDKEDENGVREINMGEVLNSMTEEQRLAVGLLLDEIQEENTMARKNAFEENTTFEAEEFAHSSQGMSYCADALSDALKYGSFKDAVMAHAATYGIDDIETLFPDPKAVSNKPEFIKREQTWVDKVMGGVHHNPFSRIKTLFADITEDAARAKGYIKGNRKVEEVFGLLGRTTSPCTVYKKQKLDKDDINDITSFDVVAWLKEEMSIMYKEEVARAILVGDGRVFSNPDKIKEDCIRPIWKDDELFSVKEVVPVASSATDSVRAKALIRHIIKSRKKYKGSGSPALFINEDLLSDMLLIEDGFGHFLYESVDKLKNTLRVSEIITVPVFDGLSRLDGTDTKYLAAILVNLNDYSVGTDAGGKLNFFDDFDIDFNQFKYLMEGRMSGALTKPFSAIVYEFCYNITLTFSPLSGSETVLGKTVGDLQSDIFANDQAFQGTLNYVKNWTGYSQDPAENSGNFIAFKAEATSGATITCKMVGGPQDGREQTLDDDGIVVSRIVTPKQKVVITATLDGGDTISKTMAFGGLKLLNENA